MNFSKVIIFLILISFLCIPVNAQIVNGGFETGTISSWDTTGSYGTYSHATSNLYVTEGVYSGRLYAYGTISNFAQAHLSQTIDVTDATSLTLDYTGVYLSGNSHIHIRLYVYKDGVESAVLLPDIVSGITTGSISHDLSNFTGSLKLKFILTGRGTNQYHSKGYLYLDDIIVNCAPPPAEGNLYIANSPSNQQWFYNATNHPNLDVYFQEIVDYQIDNFDVTHDYYINCTTSNESYLYTYNYFIDDNNGDSMDNSIYSRMGMETKILYPDSPTTYTFHLYEIEEQIKDSFPWYYWLLYPLYMLVEMFANDSDVIITELDTIEITLSKISGDNETILDILEESEEPVISDPDPKPESDSDYPIRYDLPNGTYANQTVNVSWTDEYYNLVNNTVDGLYSPIYNFTEWSLLPIYNLNYSIGEFNYHMDESFTQSTEDSSILYDSINTIYEAIHPKIRNVITYYLIWVVLLIILKKE